MPPTSSPSAWAGSVASWRPAVHDLARHLVGVYRVPALLGGAWYAVDDATADLLVSIVTASDIENLTIVGTHRDGEHATLAAIFAAVQPEREQALTRLTLAPLSEAGVGQLISASLGAIQDDDSIRRIHEMTGGNPLVVGELLEQLHRAAATLDIPVILTATNPKLLDWARADVERYGAARTIVKPFDIEDIIKTVLDLIGPA